MKKFAAILFITALLALNAFGQSEAPPTLRIVTEAPGLPSELFYGNTKVKPVRLRPGTNTPITIADNDFFIQQQYIDFLRRFPETTPDGGLNYYLPILGLCKGETECLKGLRGAMAANFFRSPEFQQKGSFVMYLYMVSLGQRPSTDAELADPAKRFERPHYSEFMTDLQSISDPNDDKAIVSAKKDALTVAWLQRAEIQSVYGSLSNAAFVQKLSQVSGVTLSQTYVDRLNAGESRAKVLRAIVESPEVNAKYYNQAFVTMEYFGFLRRDPDLPGYVFHNNRFKLGFDPAELENVIVRGFIESPEYFNRF
ncbi:MAG TPA: hypothetical protein VF723_03355 [Pyrinomonadaceae bacterium]|jgi:hypothetical protein